MAVYTRLKYVLIVYVLLACLSYCQTNVLNTDLWHKQYKLHYPETECVDSCEDLPDGDYQSCQGCQVFVTCSNGRIIDNRPCTVELGGVVWDDYTKKCEWFSSTCPLKTEDTDEETRCVRDCTELPDGDYPSCTGCDMYVTCSNGRLYGDRPCPSVLVWDNSKKLCEWQTTTCVDLKSAYIAARSVYSPRSVQQSVEDVPPWLKLPSWMKPTDTVVVVHW